MKNQCRGISLIVLIVTIIVIIILASAVVLTLSKNNPIEIAREAKFKEDVRSFQDELSLTIAKRYADNAGQWNDTINASSYNDIKAVIPSFTKEYEGKIIIKNKKLMYDEDNVSEKEKNWLEDMKIIVAPNIPVEWENSIASVTKDNVPIPKGFTYVTGTKDTGTVIQDSLGNEFVWIPSTEEQYVKDSRFYARDLRGPYFGRYDYNSNSVIEDVPLDISSESADVEKYGGFYIARYEAGIPNGDSEPTDKQGIPLSKKNKTVWTNISYNNAKASAEIMIETEYVRSGLITGTAWDRTCNFIEDSVDNILVSTSYGNYYDSTSPANVDGYGTRQKSGFSDKWCVKNIYDLAGNAWEWTGEKIDDVCFIRSGSRQWHDE